MRKALTRKPKRVPQFSNTPRLALFKQLRVTSSSDQNQRGFRHPIEQKPIRLDMAIPMPCPIPAQWMGFAASR